jgi:hypothetical protein
MFIHTQTAWGESEGRGVGRLKNESCCFAGSTIDLGVREVDRTKLKGDRRQPSKKTPLHIHSLPSLFSTKKKKKHHLIFFSFFARLLSYFFDVLVDMRQKLLDEGANTRHQKKILVSSEWVRLARVVWKDETGSESEAAPVWNNGEKDNCLSFFSL